MIETHRRSSERSKTITKQASSLLQTITSHLLSLSLPVRKWQPHCRPHLSAPPPLHRESNANRNFSVRIISSSLVPWWRTSIKRLTSRQQSLWPVATLVVSKSSKTNSVTNLLRSLATLKLWTVRWKTSRLQMLSQEAAKSVTGSTDRGTVSVRAARDVSLRVLALCQVTICLLGLVIHWTICRLRSRCSHRRLICWTHRIPRPFNWATSSLMLLKVRKLVGLSISVSKSGTAWLRRRRQPWKCWAIQRWAQRESQARCLSYAT